ncbi:Stp1/IreP family PP2C-type Ser/Thr phosphatase [Patulibacter minatonensis]|uniref:Stp1/IreP family PP2C-type Ser/Thr phosphatase n=1 Tax=Patulibacter minatonensis TaxID=298163 RepID=UPI00068810D5|nr:Stp1/IreP family PP2C-type Ser/Thr phosphatase [Patulibacter minatonensis]
MLRVIEYAQRTDTGRVRPANEDSFLARTPLFAVADGMGGAQAGEVASRMAVEVLHEGLGERSGGTVAERLRDQVVEANQRIHERAQSDSRNAGMGTTLTAAYVDERHLVVVHVGDSRLYRLRGGELERLTRDHSLVEELVRQGRLTPEEAAEHPQRSIITRALGPESEVAVDSEVLRVQDRDVFMVCSDGLTAMLSDQKIGDIMTSRPDGSLEGDLPLQVYVDALVDAANDAGGRDNITVLLFRVEGDDTPGTLGGATGAGVPIGEQPTGSHPGPDAEQATAVMPVVTAADLEREAGDDAPRPRSLVELADGPDAAGGPRSPRPGQKKRRRGLRAGPFIVLFLIACVLTGGYFASQTVYFVGSYKGLVTVYRGLPYDLPAGVRLYSANYPSSVPVDEVDPRIRKRLFDHRIRSLGDANDLVSRLERGEVVKP